MESISLRPLVAVYCGSKMGHSAQYAQAATRLGECLAASNFGLVYGGASIGLMGCVADSMLAQRAPVVGVIPQFLLSHEIAHAQLTELHVVPSMHVRKAMMAERACAFVAIAGGFGTLEELMEVATWQQLDQHEKPIMLLNTDGFYDGLLMQFDRAVQEGFMAVADRMRVHVFATPDELVEQLVFARTAQGAATGSLANPTV